MCPKIPKEIADMARVPYHEAIGSLIYCTVAIHPNIAFPTLLLAQYMENLGRVHWEAVKRTFHYLSRTKD